MPKIAVDAMGGDHAPEVVVEGALLAARDLGVEIVLVGQREAIEQELAKHPDAPKLYVVAATSKSCRCMSRRASRCAKKIRR